MPSAPSILPTSITQGTGPGLSYRLEGELVPVLHMALDGQVPVYFEHHVLLNRFTGPGRVGLQSAYHHPPAAADGGSQSGADRVGNFIGDMLKG